MSKIRFGFSTCPNDTFAFHALVHGLVELDGLEIEPVLGDVEELNHMALNGELEMTKLSYHALGLVLDDYALMRSGSALGRGCGPLLVARHDFDPQNLPEARIAVPGSHTTAHLLLSLYMGQPPKAHPMIFSQVMPQVAMAQYDAGLIIHEGRFTYRDHGLTELADLGQWWEEVTGLPIPLGCIAARRDLGRDMINRLDAALKASIAHAFANPEASRDYVKQFAQEMAPEVVDKHIELYVNDFSLDLGSEGETAVREVLAKGAECGLLPPRGKDAPLFA